MGIIHNSYQTHYKVHTTIIIIINFSISIYNHNHNNSYQVFLPLILFPLHSPEFKYFFYFFFCIKYLWQPHLLPQTTTEVSENLNLFMFPIYSFIYFFIFYWYTFFFLHINHAEKQIEHDQNVLQKHVAFFDRNHDGIVYPWETFQGNFFF